MVRSTRPRRVKRAPRRKTGKKTAKLSQPMRKAVKQIVRGEAETKRTAFYETYNDGSVNVRATGFYNARGFATQNQTIELNNTDILQLIPYVLQGVGDNQRIGNKIRVQNLSVSGCVRIAINRLSQLNMTNFKVYLYVWQHVSLKDYTNLYAANDFTQFLEDGEGSTRAFMGDPQNPGMRINGETYRVLVRKQIRLKYAGLVPAAPGGAPTSVSNSGDWFANYSINLTKHVPKILTYPENNPINVPPPQTLNAPTNSSLCMSIGFVLDNCPSDTAGTPLVNLPFIEQTYVSQLAFKDM